VPILNYRIAIIGAGPAGYFTAQSFQRRQTEECIFQIDMIERLPTPWGLVRSGIAPDHPKTKIVSKVFEKIAKETNFRLFANVELGKDVFLKDLRDVYDVVVVATGTSMGNNLNILGENLINSFSAADFIPWYNAHPDYKNTRVDLSTDTAVVIGAGNVAIDVARILILDPNKLEVTDIADHALRVLKSSKIRKVIIFGRRGPEHASFTAPELRELLKLENIDVHFDIDQVIEAKFRINQLANSDREIKTNLDLMKQIAEKPKKGVERNLEIKFLVSPKEIRGNGKVEEVLFTHNKLEDGRIVATNKTFKVKSGLIITALGYKSFEISGLKYENGRVANIAGHVEYNVYVTGWAKRGSVGVIGTNKSDASDVVDLIIKNLGQPKNNKGLEQLLKPGHKVIDQVGWEKINASEVIAGEITGKPRLKEVDWMRLLNLGGR
jgi:ferredoxin--NADP+ reductase